MNNHDKKLWETMIATREAYYRARADFLNQAESRVSFLKTALGKKASHRDIVEALLFLKEFGDDVPELIDELVYWLCSETGYIHAYQILLRKIQVSPELRHPDLLPRLRASIRAALSDDPEIYSREYHAFAGLLKAAGDYEMLAELVESAKVYRARLSNESNEDKAEIESMEDFIEGITRKLRDVTGA